MIGFRISEDRDRILENIIFIKLKRRAYEIYYYKGVNECDFVLRNGSETKQVIQVCVDLDNFETKLRNFTGQLEAMDKFSLYTGLIITEYEEKTETLNINNKEYTILIKPSWKWLRD